MRRLLFLVLFASHLLVVLLMTILVLTAAGHAQVTDSGGLNARILSIALLVAALSAVPAALIAHRLARPVKDLSRAFRRMGEGDLEVRIMPGRRGELKRLGDSFNEMAFRTKSMLGELTGQHEALNTIIAAISEGLMVVDSTGRIVLANDSFRKLAATPDAEGRYYWEVIREPGLAELVKSASTSGRPVTGGIGLANRTYVCGATHLPSTGRTVVTLHDVTQIASTAQMKRELVVNVSHELRTPLTAIKGYVETLEESVGPDGRRYLDIIKRHTERLANLVQDLLTLSELEEKGTSLQTETVDVAALMADVLRFFERPAQDKGLSLALESQPGLPRVKADPFKLEQVFINLLDNAVKYTEQGSIVVTLTSQDAGAETSGTGRKVIVRVRDTGIGISRDHLPRIFERFYVADKSRSRQLGGTGLGLSIVKHIVLLHGGEITVDSTPGAGTTFTVTVPAV